MRHSMLFLFICLLSASMFITACTNNEPNASNSGVNYEHLSHHRLACELESDVPTYQFFDSIGIVHNELLYDQLVTNFLIPMGPDNDIEENQLFDYYLHSCDYYMRNNISGHVNLVDFTGIYTRSLYFDYVQFFGYDPFYSNYIDSIIDIEDEVVYANIYPRLRTLQQHFYQSAFIDNNAYEYYHNTVRATTMMVMLSVAANSAEFWRHSGNTIRLRSFFDINGPIGLEMKWWKADMIGAAVGWLTVWWGAILWGAVSSIVVAIKESLIKSKKTEYYKYHNDQSVIYDYDLYRIGQSKNPYLLHSYAE